MQKTLDILEKNVQWIVLAFAALFLVWVAYGYVLTPPATVKINNRLVTPGDVALVTKGAADKLESQIKNNQPVSFPTPDLVTSWREHMGQPFGVALASDTFNSQPSPAGGPSVWIANNGGPRINALPIPPAPQLLPLTAGLSTVIPQAPNLPQIANNAANPPAPGNPVQPAVAPAPKDTDWITVPAVIPAKAFAEAMLAPFKGAALNPALGTLYNTTILQVLVEREQSSGMKNGAPVWGGDTTVVALLAEQPYLMHLPLPTADMGSKYQYIDWARQNQALLCTPSFYQVSAGDPWIAPQLPPPVPPAGNNPQPGAGPAQPGPGPAQPGPGPATNPAAPVVPNTAGMRMPANASYAPVDPARPPGMGFPQPGRFRPNGGVFIAPAGNGNNGFINPFNMSDDLLIWVIDETVTPGQTYRYRIKYIIKNPVFDVKNMAPDKLTDDLSIVSLPSDWSAPIKAPPMTKFWVADAQRDHAKLDVFQYSDGTWKTKNMTAGPGDDVPGTDLTLVDVRSTDSGHGHEKYVLLTSNTGDLITRDVNTDQTDPDHQAMLNPNPNGTNAPNGPRPGQRPIPPTTPQRSFRPTLGH